MVYIRMRGVWGMILVREMNMDEVRESWVEIPINTAEQRRVMISMKDEATFTTANPPAKYPKYFFRKGAVVVLLSSGEAIYNKVDLIRIEKM